MQDDQNDKLIKEIFTPEVMGGYRFTTLGFQTFHGLNTGSAYLVGKRLWKTSIHVLGFAF